MCVVSTIRRLACVWCQRAGYRDLAKYLHSKHRHSKYLYSKHLHSKYLRNVTQPLSCKSICPYSRPH